ncbi:MAG: DUF1993 domain-containing protein [Sphingobium sp.]
MTSSLYDATIPQFQQMLPGVIANLGRAETWAREKGQTAKEMLGSRLAPDMLPLAAQFHFVAVHSGGAINALKEGVFHIPTEPAPMEFADLHKMLTDAQAVVDQATPEVLEAAQSRTIALDFSGRTVKRFTGAEYLLSFAQPNFFFHSVTAYSILRTLGVSIGKSDYLGAMRSLPD